MDLLTIFGYLGLCFFGYNVLRLLWQLFRPAKDLSKLGSWTVITGATDGLGKSMAFELARKGQNLLIIGRNPQKLQNTEREISNKHSSIQIETLKIDLAKFPEDVELQNKYSECIKNKDVGVLVNNAGLSYKYTNHFHEVDQQRIKDMINVNNMSSVILTHRTISKFLKKKKGAIVNVSSVAAIVPHAFHVVYSGTKSFLNKLSWDLASEYSASNITCGAHMPWFVCSKMSKIRRPSFDKPSSEDYAKAAVKQIGYNGLISPYPVHAVMFFFFDFMPNFMLNPYFTKLFKKIKRYGDRKHSRQNSRELKTPLMPNITNLKTN